MTQDSDCVELDRDYYVDLLGNVVFVPEFFWLEDGRDVDGNRCARYCIGGSESVWINEDNQEVETD